MQGRCVLNVSSRVPGIICHFAIYLFGSSLANWKQVMKQWGSPFTQFSNTTINSGSMCTSNLTLELCSYAPICYIGFIRFYFHKGLIIPQPISSYECKIHSGTDNKRVLHVKSPTSKHFLISCNQVETVLYKLLVIGPVIRADVGRSEQVRGGGQRPLAHAITSRPNNAQH